MSDKSEDKWSNCAVAVENRVDYAFKCPQRLKAKKCRHKERETKKELEIALEPKWLAITADALSASRVESVSILKCLALSTSARQIRLKSSIS